MPSSHAKPGAAPQDSPRPSTARVGRDGRYREASEDYARRHGMSAGALAGRKVREVLGEAAWAAAEPYVERALAGEAVSFALSVPLPGGERLVEAHYIPEPDGFLAVIFDRTDAARVEKAHEALLAQAGEGIVEVDIGGRIVRANERFCEILGRTAADVTGKTLRDLTYPGDPFVDSELLKRLAQASGRATLEKRYRRGDGSPVWASTSVAVLRGEGGRPTGGIAVVHDLTARRETQAALRESEERHRAMGEASPIGLFTTSLTGELLYINPLGAQLHGAPAEKLLGAAWLELVHPEDLARVRAQIAASRREGRLNAMEYRIVLADGAVRWISGKAAPTRSADGAPLGYAGCLEDVTDRRQAELERQALLRQFQDERRRLSDLMDALPAVVWESRGSRPEDLRVSYISPYATQLLGTPIGDFLSNQVLSERLLHPDDRAGALETVRRAMETGQPGRCEFRAVARDGRVHWLEARARPILDRFGRTVGMRGVAVDITARKQAEEAMRRGEEAQREFIANVSHDFRTPLASIRGYAETLLRGADASEPPAVRRRFMSAILRNAERLSELVEDILTVSSLDSGATHPEPEAIELATFARSMTEDLEPLLRSKRLALRCAVPAGLFARFDRGHLAQVLQNLLGNAMRYNRRGGWIDLTARLGDSSCVELCVADGGIGIAPEHLPRVFDRFYRVDRVRSTAARASGLGLHIVKRLVEAGGGRVWAESAPDEGSQFYFTAPAVEARA